MKRTEIEGVMKIGKKKRRRDKINKFDIYGV